MSHIFQVPDNIYDEITIYAATHGQTPDDLLMALLKKSADRLKQTDFMVAIRAEMSGDAAVELLQLFAQNGIDIFVDGGWGVDALLGEQTRSHEDLDVALQHRDVPRLRALLEARGYKDAPRDDTWECNFVMGDNKGHEIDIHSYTFDAHGKNVFGVEYPLDSLTGAGSIQGYPVKCISVEWMVKFHTGYKLDENDYRDVSALCERFGIVLPAEYERFTHQSSD